MITAATLTNGTFTLILDNGEEILTATKTHPNWDEIVEAHKTQNESLLRNLMSMKKVVEEFSDGGLVIDGTGITYNGRHMHGIDVDRALAFLKEGLPYEPYAKYLQRKMKNPSARSIAELYGFLEHKNMPLTPEGKFIAYKGVGNDFYSIMGNPSTVVLQGTVNAGGHILNAVGETIEVERSSVDDNFNNGCSFGLHAGSLQYALGWGHRVVLVEIDPADAVSVPDCSEHQKLRCCKYKVIGEFSGRLPDAYTDEFSSNTNDEDSDSDSDEDDDNRPCCNHCGDFLDNCTCVICNICDEEESMCDCYDCVGCGRNENECECEEIEQEEKEKKLTQDEINKKIDKMFDDPSVLEVIAPSVATLEGAVESFISKMDSSSDAENLESAKKLQTQFDKVFDDQFGANSSRSIGSSDLRADSSYMNGLRQGISDCQYDKPSTYLKGDESGADSENHYKYILGYVYGYSD